MKTSERVLAEARTMRRKEIRRLRLCNCGVPIRVLRNGSGHDPECPAHADWEREHEREAAR